jgi:two-component system OmpR family sensor kinase
LLVEASRQSVTLAPRVTVAARGRLALLRRLADRLPAWHRWPVRWWLAVVTASIAGGTLLALGVLLMLLLEGGLQRQLADSLRSQAAPVLERELGALPSGPKPPGKPSGKPDTPALPDDPAGTARVRLLAPVLIRELAGRDTGIVVYDARKRLVAASAPAARQEPWPQAPGDAIERALAGRETDETVRQRSRRTLVLLLPLRPPGSDVIGVLQVSTSLELIDELQMRLALALAVGFLLAVIVAGGLAGWVARAALGPLEQMVRTTRRIAGGDLSARVRSPRRDEVGELAASFDQMVDRLEAAFAAQRQLVSDAAHELRTPLNGLAGTLEIVQVGLQRGDLDGASRLLGSVEGELDRLGRLVNDLLTLSSLDERSPTPMSPVALVTVLRDVVRRARILAPDHAIGLHVQGASAQATVLGNRDQLERVFTNVLDNAVKYTPADGRIDMTLEGASSA